MQKKYLAVGLILFVGIGIIVWSVFNVKRNNIQGQIKEQPAKMVSQDNINTVDGSKNKIDKTGGMEDTNKQTITSDSVARDEDQNNIDEMSASSKLIGPKGGDINIILSNKTKVKLTVPEKAFDENIEVKIEELKIQPYSENTIGLFSLQFDHNNLSPKGYISLKVIPQGGINFEQKDMLQVFKLQKRKSGRQFWERGVMYNVNDELINIILKEAGYYKVQYSSVKIGG